MQVVLPVHADQRTLVGHIVRGFPTLDQHAAAALVQVNPTFGQVAFVAPDQHQDGAEQRGGSQL